MLNEFFKHKFASKSWRSLPLNHMEQKWPSDKWVIIFFFQIYVSESLANLYTKKPSDKDWQLKYTGIPLVILDIGESRARDKRKIQIALAERGTSFMLWNDIIDNLSDYKVSAKSFHTMCFSQDHTIQVGFSFDTAPAAHDLWRHIESLIACPENISLSTPGEIYLVRITELIIKRI